MSEQRLTSKAKLRSLPLLLTSRNKSGKVENVVIGVGGFLGMGEHDVAVNFDRLKWSDSAATTGSGQSAAESKKTDRNYPDHAVLNATKDQLKAMPNFQYSK